MSLKRNTAWNLLGAGIPLLAALFSIPYLLKVLGNEGFGVLTLVWALIGYFSLFDFGVGRALTYELGRRASASVKEQGPYIRAGLFLTFITGLIGAAFVGAIANQLSNHWLKIGKEWQADSLTAFYYAALGIIPTTITSGLRGALEGTNKFSTSNINRMVTGILMFALPAWSVYFHGNSIGTATLYLISARTIMMFFVVYQLHQYLFSSNQLQREHWATLLNYGLWITVTGIVGPLMVYGDRFFVSAAIGAEMLPQYAIPQEGLQRLLLIPAALCGALLPQLAGLSSQGIHSIYKRNLIRVTWGMLSICLLTAAIAYPGLSLWVSKDFATKALPITLILIVGILLNSIAMVPYTVLHAMGAPKITAIFHLVELAVYFVLIWILTNNYGLIGAAMAWTIRVLIDLILLKIAVNKFLKI